jgi:hypothetical protein
MSDITTCSKSHGRQRSDKCKKCMRCHANANKLTYGTTVTSLQSDNIEKCIAAVDPSLRPITTGYYPPVSFLSCPIYLRLRCSMIFALNYGHRLCQSQA